MDGHLLGVEDLDRKPQEGTGGRQQIKKLEEPTVRTRIINRFNFLLQTRCIGSVAA